MRPLVCETVTTLPVVPDATLDQARNESSQPDAHARFLNDLEPFRSIEARPPATPIPVPARLRVAAFNAERLKDVSGVRALLDQVRPQIALLTEVDVGMARSGNIHTLKALTQESGEGYFYGVEFLELDLGDKLEMREHRGQRNAAGFHGNAIVSNLALCDPHLIPLEESGLWFGGQDGAQRRIGGRMALAARVADAPRPLWVVSVHLESKTDPLDRRMQIRALLDGLATFVGRDACIIGGDLNTKEVPAQDWALEEAARYEPLFGDFQAAGFTWRDANAMAVTQRTGPSGSPRPPFRKIDWMLVRGAEPFDPKVVPALDPNNRPISDHEMLALTIVLDGST